MLKWLVDGRVRESWTRYSVAVYLGLLLAGTLSAEPPVPPQPDPEQALPPERGVEAPQQPAESLAAASQSGGEDAAAR